jgi:NADPH:quinone reductase-like Zn-dependent oxidoreductase
MLRELRIAPSISEHGSIQLAQQAFSPRGGHLITLLYFKESDLVRADVRTDATLVYTALGHDIDYGTRVLKSEPDDRALFAKWTKLSTEFFKEGKIRPLKVDIMGGLEDIQHALDLLKEGKHRNKMVINVA